MTAYEYMLDILSKPLPSSCMAWPFQRDKDGYGKLRLPMSLAGKRIKVTAHRLAFKLHYGDWPKPLGLHSCDNPSCFNPLHVTSGDHAKNQGEKAQRGRSLRGVQQHDAKLTEEVVRKARAEYVPGYGGNGFHRLAKKYGVSKRAMMLAVSGKTWKHVQI
jgi:hypothetical protein